MAVDGSPPAMATGMAVTVAVAVAILGTATAIREKHVTSNVTQTLDLLLASDRYDRRLRPGFGGPPITIAVNFFIKSIGPVSDNDESFGLDCYFRQHWYDSRLKYQKLPGLDEFSMSWLFLDRVWKPDTYFVNGKKSFLHRITVPNKFLRLRHDGFITYSMRLTILANCPMYLRKFPLDTQRCPLIVGSYGYSNKDLVYKWTDGEKIGLQKGVEIAQFDLVNITTQNERTMIKSGLPYSVLEADFWLKRHAGYFMLQVYIPCCLIVVCSWISFWIDPDAVPARVNLGVTTVLTLTTMGFGGRSQMPKVSYWTALDWFVIICFTYVFSVIIEYALVNLKDKFRKDFKKMIEKQKMEEALKDKSKTTALKRIIKRGRSASLPFFRWIPEKAEIKSPQFTLSPVKKPCKKRLKTVSVHFQDATEGDSRWKSIPNLKMDRKDEDGEDGEKASSSPWASLTNSEEDLMDLKEESIEVILDLESEEGREDQVGVDGEKENGFWNFFEKWKKKKMSRRNFWKKFKFKSEKSRILSEMEDSTDKFSRLDVQSRKHFPITFIFSLTVYLLAFIYFLSDDNPIVDSELNQN